MSERLLCAWLWAQLKHYLSHSSSNLPISLVRKQRLRKTVCQAASLQSARAPNNRGPGVMWQRTKEPLAWHVSSFLSPVPGTGGQ